VATRPRRRRLCVLGFLLALASLIPATPASAHATFVGSDPPGGSTLSGSADTILLWFDEGIRLEFSTFDLRHLSGRAVRDVQARQPRPGLVTLTLPELEHDVYTLSWSVLSAIDTHVSAGSLILGVGMAVSAPLRGSTSEPAAALRPDEVALRWLDVVFLSGMIGALIVYWVVLRPAGMDAASSIRRAARRRILVLAAWLGVAALGMGVLLMRWQVLEVSAAVPGSSWRGVLPGLLFDSRYGALWWGRELVLAALTAIAWMLWVAERPREEAGSGPGHGERLSDRLWPPTAALVVATALIHAASGHAAGGARPWFSVAVDGLHFVAAGVWIGGLLALAVGLLPLLRRRDDVTALARLSWRPFSRVAAVSVGVLVATGLSVAAREVASIDALVLTPYGKALMVKIGVGMAAAAIGLMNALLLRPSLAAPLARLLHRPAGWTPLSPRRLPRLIAIEIALGMVALGAVGTMTSTPPAKGPSFAPSVANAPSSLSEQIDDLLVTVTVEPNRPGANVLTVRAISTTRPPRSEVGTVLLALETPEGSTSLSTTEVGEGTFRTGVDRIASAGPMEIAVVVRRSGLPDSAASFDWTVNDGGPNREPVISDHPLGPALTAAAAAVALILLSVLLGIRVSRGASFRSGQGTPQPSSPHEPLLPEGGGI